MPARDIALLPASLGGLGLSQATRTSPAAYWAAWADALIVLRARCPALRIGRSAASSTSVGQRAYGQPLRGAGAACARRLDGRAPDDRRRLDLVIYGAAQLGGVLCCDATLVSPLTRDDTRSFKDMSLSTRDGEPHPGAAAQDGAVLHTAGRANPLRARRRSGWAVERRCSAAGQVPCRPPRAQSSLSNASPYESGVHGPRWPGMAAPPAAALNRPYASNQEPDLLCASPLHSPSRTLWYGLFCFSCCKRETTPTLVAVGGRRLGEGSDLPVLVGKDLAEIRRQAINVGNEAGLLPARGITGEVTVLLTIIAAHLAANYGTTQTAPKLRYLGCPQFCPSLAHFM
ncbi:ccdc135 [Symbiodinium natans]|uniref:Ccdc135 protein n=1 Tax=Symbiodinium natans TaxID=878477 RepID=A0A812M6N7_9DINO|nr:ccdc135 [Symbiodinium natans]